MTEKLLTISVAAYNGAETLDKALKSCLVQRMKQLEVLIVDDGSTDNTAAIALQYERKYPHTFRLIQKENGGYGSTINRTIEEAKGRYYRTLDCDDWFEDGSLQKFLDRLENLKVDAIYTNYQTFYSGKMRAEFNVCEGYDSEKIYSFEELENADLCMEMHALTFRTEMLRGANINLPEHSNYTDMLYTFCGIKQTKTISFCPIQMYCYQLGIIGQSVSLESYQRHMKEYVQIAFTICKYAQTLSGSSMKQSVLQRRAGKIAQEGVEIMVRFPVNESTYQEIHNYIDNLQNQFPQIFSGIRNKNTIYLKKFKSYFFYMLINRYTALKHKIRDKDKDG